MKYVRLYFDLVRRGISAQMEFRASFWMGILANLLTYGLTILFFEVIYLHTDSIGGWKRFEVLILVSVAQIMESLYRLLFAGGISEIPYHVWRGSLDGFLTEPVNTQFLLSCRRFMWEQIAGIIFPIFVIVYSTQEIQVSLNSLQATGFLFLLLCALIIRYALAFILMTTSFWATKSEALYSLYEEIFTLSKYPASIYRGITKIFFTFVIPVIVVGNFPTTVLIRSFKLDYLLIAAIISSVLLYISHKFWQFGVKHYTSVSS